MMRAKERPASVSESEPSKVLAPDEERSTGRSEVKRAMFDALRQWLAHGTSDFEGRRIRARGAALEKFRKSEVCPLDRRSDNPKMADDSGASVNKGRDGLEII